MTDIYAQIAEVDDEAQGRIADVLELRAADPQQRAMLDAYIGRIGFGPGARVLEIGCGTGAVARVIADVEGVGEVVGVDPGRLLIARARELAAARERLSFVVGDGRALPFDAGRFDVTVCHTSLCHIPSPERVLAEAARVTVREGWLAIFEGDYATTTVATSVADPLQACVDAAIEALVHDRFIVRRLGRMVRDAGWSVAEVSSHGYLEVERPTYMRTIIDRGADALVASRRLGPDAARALKEEAERRAGDGTFFGHIAYASVIARRGPDPL